MGKILEVDIVSKAGLLDRVTGNTPNIVNGKIKRINGKFGNYFDGSTDGLYYDPTSIDWVNDAWSLIINFNQKGLTVTTYLFTHWDNTVAQTGLLIYSTNSSGILRIYLQDDLGNFSQLNTTITIEKNKDQVIVISKPQGNSGNINVRINNKIEQLAFDFSAITGTISVLDDYSLFPSYTANPISGYLFYTKLLNESLSTKQIQDETARLLNLKSPSLPKIFDPFSAQGALPPSSYSDENIHFVLNRKLFINGNIIKGSKNGTSATVSGQMYYTKEKSLLGRKNNNASVILDTPFSNVPIWTIHLRRKFILSSTTNQITPSLAIEQFGLFRLKFTSVNNNVYAFTKNWNYFRDRLMTGTFISDGTQIHFYDNGVYIESITPDNTRLNISTIFGVPYGQANEEYEYILKYGIDSPQEIKAYHDKWGVTKINYKLDDIPVGDDLPKHDWYPVAGSGEIVEADNTSQLPVGTKTFKALTTPCTKALPSTGAEGTWYFESLISQSAIILHIIKNDKTDSITNGYRLEFSTTLRLVASGVSQLWSAIGALNITRGTAIDLLFQRLGASGGEFPLLPGVSYPAWTFGVWYRESGTKKWILVPVSSGSNPVTDSTYTTSKFMVNDLDANDEHGLIRYNSGLKVY